MTQTDILAASTARKITDVCQEAKELYESETWGDDDSGYTYISHDIADVEATTGGSKGYPDNVSVTIIVNDNVADETATDLCEQVLSMMREAGVGAPEVVRQTGGRHTYRINFE